MKTEIATTQDQSIRLLACGVSADTADMTITAVGGYISMDWSECNYNTQAIAIRNLRENIASDYRPAWSLSALLDILPKELTDYRMTRRYEPFTDFVMTCCAPYFINGSLHLYHNGKKYVVDYDWDGFLGQMPCADDPIEACVLAIELLAANGYKLNEQ